MRPVLYSVWFESASKQYARLARVLDRTARKHCPGWDVRVEKVDPPEVTTPTGTQSFADNSWKLGYWTRAVTDAPDGAEILLVDSDTFVTRDLSPLWDIDFDVAITVRETARFPLNGGVVAVRVNSTTRKFMEAWLGMDRQFLANPAEHRPWRRKYGGMNQSSLGYMLELSSPFSEQFNVARLPCLEWNCEDTSWARFDPEVTRIVHVKSALRMAVFGIGPRRDVRHLASMWHALEAVDPQ